MKSLENKIKKIDDAFDKIFADTKPDYENDARVLASKILSQVKNESDSKKLYRKDIAKKIGTSASYLTQLYRGSKTLNLVTLCKLLDKLDLDIDIDIYSNKYNVQRNDDINDYYERLVNIDGIDNAWLIYSDQPSKKESIVPQTYSHNVVKSSI